MADPREEIEIKLNGSTFRSRPTFAIIASIEAATGQSARALGLKALTTGLPLSDRTPAMQEISMSEMAVTLFHMIRDQKDAPTTIDKLGEVLMEEGYVPLCMPVGNFLIRAQRGNKEHIKELERQAEIERKKKAESGDPPTTGPGTA